MIDASFLGQIGRFDLVIKKKVLSQYNGERESSNTGEGLIFKDYREYIPGDDFRQIDWALYARSDKYFIKRYEADKNMTMHILIDASSSMDFGTKITKYEYASMIGLGFAYLSTKNNERFELSTFAEKMDFIKPKKGKNALLEILDHLNKKKVEGKSKFFESLAAFKKRLKSKSMIVIISDFLFDLEELEQTLLLFRRSEVVVLQVLDEEETRFNMAGEYHLKDSEQGNIIRTFISNRLRSTYRTKMDVHMARIKKACDQIGARYIYVTTSTDIFDTFYKVLK